MVEGFETRDNTDKPVRAFVESAKGHMWKKATSVDQYEQTEWQGFENITKPIVVFGMLRGTSQLIQQCRKLLLF